MRPDQYRNYICVTPDISLEDDRLVNISNQLFDQVKMYKDKWMFKGKLKDNAPQLEIEAKVGKFTVQQRFFNSHSHIADLL